MLSAKCPILGPVVCLYATFVRWMNLDLIFQPHDLIQTDLSVIYV